MHQASWDALSGLRLSSAVAIFISPLQQRALKIPYRALFDATCLWSLAIALWMHLPFDHR